MGVQHKDDDTTMYEIEKLFYKKLYLEEAMRYGNLLRQEKCLCRVRMKIFHPEWLRKYAECIGAKKKGKPDLQKSYKLFCKS